MERVDHGDRETDRTYDCVDHQWLLEGGNATWRDAADLKARFEE